MKDFAGRTAFVTGGANGVGIGLVRALLAQGCNVAIADIRPASIDAALRALDNPRAMGVEVDVSSRQDLARAAEAVEAKFGIVSLLFNNAGVNLFQTVEESSYDDWDWLMGVNLHGPINGVMTFVPRMIRAGQGGYVVNTASMAAFLAAGVCGIYNTTKFAVRGLSESLRASLAPHGIGVSVLCPGLVKSYIYASDEVRPTGLKAGAKPVNTENVKRLAAVHEFGMEPDVIAARVLEAMREDRFHIFTHPEFKDELSEVFGEIMQDFRDYPVDPGHGQRTDFEKTRRESYRKQRRGLKAS
ncbi:MAG: SDR family NAD(P)-dependent oxidoreductase [Gammaproteobacteria bacterium]|nr:MAG: SDR family NAD(P)-dependent oxidoreductase [Gammaproteobacteria bacterium]TLY85506.1 MAG: SDR family NAD(P)-dependent oxidoreductase [Gammaproteobacteria bacterium]